ncbi:MAG: S1 RNA-binding domain-containing protein [Clostridia bacterium]|nr:S1 RNA-binding domain-containing protein [Clostridia bacterium]
MQLEVGTVLDGKVNGITNFGAFIDLPGNKKGLVHISEISTDYVKNIEDYLKYGQEVKVKIININTNGDIKLSIKRLYENPENEAKSRKKGIKFEKAHNPEKKKSFEEMMSMFKAASEEKMSDLKRNDSFKRSPRKNSRRAGI